MEAIYPVLGSVTVLFVFFLGTKQLLPERWSRKLCAICTAVSTTWMALLVLHWLGIFNDRLILALMMGSSILGVYYLLVERLRRSLRIFRLPIYLSLLLAGYSAISLTIPSKAVLLIAILWAAFGALYAYRAHESVKGYVDSVIECCREW